MPLSFMRIRLKLKQGLRNKSKIPESVLLGRFYTSWRRLKVMHPEWIQNEEMMRQKIEYIHRNPVERGYVDQAEHWRYSSARNYQGMDGLLEVCKQW
jgi:REP-associated tyrosine transposase